MKTPFLYILLFSFAGFSQNRIDSLKTYVISETLPSYLNRNSNSAASYLKQNDVYTLIRSSLESSLKMLPEKDSLLQIELENHIKHLDLVADSLKQVLLTKKIQVRIKDSLYPYIYVAEKYSDLRKPEDWSYRYNDLKADFIENKWVRLDTTISMEFADLIKMQIDSSEKNELLKLKDLSNGFYEFKNILDNCLEEDLCFYGYKLYQPVFNKALNKACYLFSFECKSGICRDFIFVEKRNNKWIYVDSYPSHLIGHED